MPRWPMSSSIRSLRQQGREILSQHQDYSVAALETDLLLSETVGMDRLFLELNPEKMVLEEHCAEFERRLQKRSQGMPIAYLLGHREFMGYDFFVEEGVLIPRHDTEVLVEATTRHLKKLNQPSIRGLELGIGTGIISLVLLSRLPNLSMLGADINPKAISLSIRNAAYLDNQLSDEGGNAVSNRFYARESNWYSAFENEKFDCIISNPPYIATEVIATLDRDVKDYEPMRALDGGADGLDCYREILTQGMDRLLKNGFFAFEIGYDQAERVKALMQEHGLDHIETHTDLAGHTRVVIGFLS